MKTKHIVYTIEPINLSAHHFKVTCEVIRPDPFGQCFALPAWIPGSYMIRNFARNILSISAQSAGKSVLLTKIDKHTWQAAPVKTEKSLFVSYEVYAFEFSVRHAYLDERLAFFNGTSVFLRVIGNESLPCLVDIRPPASLPSGQWQVATTLPLAHGEKRCANPSGFGLYRGSNYDELIDHPVVMGEFSPITFMACGIRHDIVICGRHDVDTARLASDIKTICEWQIRFFGEPAPLDRYLFIMMLSGEGFGGLEHRASTTLICPRGSLPYPGMKGMDEAYQALLGLVSHEYFHLWHVKRIKPEAFIDYDLDQENHTRLLWLFEGFTSYYDDLTLLRSGLIAEHEWLALMAKNITMVCSAPGRFRQSLEESSFDAWTKYYITDENTPNTVVSYYTKGALVAFALDLTLRQKTDGKVTLDDVMRQLWQRFGQTETGVGNDDVRLLAEELCGFKLKRFFDHAVRSTNDLPFKRLLLPFGIRLDQHEGPPRQATASLLGIKFESRGEEIRLVSVLDGQCAQQAGLYAGDVLVAINGWRIKPENFNKMLMRYPAGEKITVHVFRREELLCVNLVLPDEPAGVTVLSVMPGKNTLRRALLGMR